MIVWRVVGYGGFYMLSSRREVRIFSCWEYFRIFRGVRVGRGGVG